MAKVGVSGREFGRMMGVSHTAVVKAIAAGRITTEPDGSIIPEKAQRQWSEQTDPAKQRQAPGRAAPGAAMRAVPRTAAAAVGATLQGAGADPGEDGAPPSIVRARLANEIIKANTAKVRLAKMQGELVDRAKATAMVYELARRERDSWMNWPARCAANMAADLGLEPHAVQEALERYVREQLADLAEIKLELR